MKLNKKNGLLVATAAMMPALVAAQEAQRPNIMFILVDDMGYSDLQCFGGEVQSPSLNSLAEDGSRFTQFFNCGRSCPSRASLMTGCYPHEVGITGMGLDLSTNCVTVAEVLQSAGYHTGMSGKWHLSRTQDMGNPNQMIWQSHQGFFDRDFANRATYPCNRGFDEHWGTIWGVSDHFDPFSLVHNEVPIFTDGIPDGFYYADFVADKAIDMLQGYAGDSDPFFMYVAFQEPHWPVQAKPEDIAKYNGVYDEGWEVLRNRRYNKMVELGIVDPAQTPNAPNESGRSWASESRKQWQADNMEVHAAMVDCVDQNIGRIIAYLKANGLYDNTLIIFSSDNGASSENYGNGSFDRHNMTRDGQSVIADAEVPGSQLTYNYIHDGWAGAVNAPFRYWKRQSFHGGVAAPTIIKWPASMNAPKNNIVNEPCNFIDFMPTCLELSGATYPSTYNGHTIQPIAEEARSLVPMAQADAHWDTERIMFWEHENGMAVRTANWRLTKHTDGDWQLFDMRTDYSETKNVASAHPDVVLDLKKKWQAWAVDVGLRNAPLSIQAGKVYSISNRNDNNLYIQDNGGNPLPMAAFNENSYWKFEPTGNDDCYYIRNVTSGRYAQACPAAAEQPVNMGTTKVEYKIQDCSVSEGTDCFGITSTDHDNTSFTSGCIGWNWKGGNTVQSFAATEGTNHRSFWKITEVNYVDPNDHWPLNGKTFSISNRNDNNLYIQDNGGNPLPMAAFNENSYWQFEPTSNDDCYYIKNVTSGRYAQACPATAEQPVNMGTTKVEYKVLDCSASEGANCYGITSTDRSNTNFTSGCIGWNWKGDNTVQSFAAAAGTNHRSFWKLTEVALPAPVDKWPLNGKVFTLTNKMRAHNVDSYMQDNGWDDNRIECAASTNAYAYWTFEKTANANCYYIRNTATGRYLQANGASGSTVILGNEPAEYFVKYFDNEGAYGLSATANTPHDCTTSGTLGLNLRNESDEADCCVQSFAAVAGTNHRSFWLLTEVENTQIRISAAKYASFVAPFDVEFATNQYISAYVVSKIENGYITLQETDKVAGGTAVIVRAATGTYGVYQTDDVEMPSNELKASRSDITVSENKKFWVLAKPESKDVGFYPVSVGTTIAVAKGYLELDNPALINQEYFGFSDEDPTAIKGIVVDKLNGSREVYNLAGQHIAKMQRGVNIVNGKKVLK